MNFEKLLGKSWKTSLAGIGALLTLAGDVLVKIFDGDPTTNVDMVALIPIVILAIGKLFAKDSDVTGGTRS